MQRNNFIFAQKCLFISLGSVILAFGLYHVHSQSLVTEGGVLGLTLLLQHWLGISPAISGLILNLICYFVGWRTLGKSFVLYSALAGGAFSLAYAALELCPPLFPDIAQHPLEASLLGAIFVGAGVGLCVLAGGAPSGDDALAMSLSHLLRCKIAWIYLITDLTVLALSLTYIPLRRILYSLLTVVVSGQIIGQMQKIPFPKKSKHIRQEK